MNNIDLYGLTCFKVKLKVDKPKEDVGSKYLILESDPNPDYYARHSFPPNEEHEHQKHLYLLVKNSINCFQDVILRNTSEIRKQFNFLLNIYPGSLTFHNDNYQCVRVDTTNSSQILPLIKTLNNLGIKFIKDKKLDAFVSLIHYKKYVEYHKIDEDVYQDISDPYRFFFQINKHLNFDDFLKGMEQIKFNCNFHMFDAFLSDMFIRNEMLDFIGLYSKHCDQTRFSELKEKLKKYFDK
jgi:hypothetical protein